MKTINRVIVNESETPKPTLDNFSEMRGKSKIYKTICSTMGTSAADDMGDFITDDKQVNSNKVNECCISIGQKMRNYVQLTKSAVRHENSYLISVSNSN